MSATFRSRYFLLLTTLAIAVSLGPLAGQATGQISRAAGPSTPLIGPEWIGGAIRGTSSAYDNVNNVRLVVGSHDGLAGIFVNTDGSPVSAPFTIWPAEAVGSAQFPTVTFSPDLTDLNGNPGAFLVTWQANLDSPGFPNYVHARVVSFRQSQYLVRSTFVVSDTASFHEVGAAAAVAYSPTNRAFLVAWQTYFPSTPYRIRGRLLRVDTLSADPVFEISTGEAQYPSVAYNPVTKQFGVGYSGFGSSGATSTFALVSTSGTVLSRNTFNVAHATFITDLAVNPTTGRYVMTWSQGDGTRVAEFAGNGTLQGIGVVSSVLGGSDSGSLAYSAASDTFLVVGHSHNGEVAAAELSSRGNRIGAVVNGSAAGPFGISDGAFYPRVTSIGAQNRWGLTFSKNLSSVQSHIVITSTPSGGGHSTIGGGTTPPSAGGCPGTAPFPGAVCQNGGWVPGTGGGTGPGGGSGCPGTAPFPGAVCQNGGWVAGTGGTGPGGGSGCPGAAPFAGAVCQNGGWVPGTGGGTGPGGGSGCPGSAPFPGAVCQNGGWVAGGSGDGNPGGGSGCPGTAPFAGAVCQNGGWVPGTGPGGGSGCSGTAPFAGAVCQNGGWVPGTGTGPGGGSGCSGTAPFAGAVCQNGGWVPGTGTGPGGGSGCPGTAPFPGAVCQNGGWVPGTGTGGGSTCQGSAPFAGAVCQNGGWVPGGGGTTPPASSCTSVRPGANWTCISGAWMPPGMASATLTPSATFARSIDLTGHRRPTSMPASLLTTSLDRRLI